MLCVKCCRYLVVQRCVASLTQPGMPHTQMRKSVIASACRTLSAHLALMIIPDILTPAPVF